MKDTEYWSLEFPDVAGWLSDGEGRFLAECTKSKVVLEIGSFQGRSTIWMARTAEFVYAVDPFEGHALHEFKQNLLRHEIKNVFAFQGKSPEKLDDIIYMGFDFAFIDGDHSREAVEKDIAAATRLLKPGSMLAFHDYRRACDPGVTEAVDAFLASGAELVKVVGTVALVKPGRKE